MASLSVQTRLIAYADSSVSANPQLKNFDWFRTLEGIPVENPTQGTYSVESEETLEIFDASVSTSIDTDTAFDVSENPTLDSTYRFTFSAGTDPEFRTARSININGADLTISVSGTRATFTLETGVYAWTGVQTGDIMFVPGVSTGDVASDFDSLNEGWWRVLSASTKNLIVSRLVGETFEAKAEVIEIGSADAIQVFSLSGVQVGDKVDVLGGFNINNRKTYTITAVTPEWFEVVSSISLVEETGIIPGVSGMVFYSGSKSFLYMETDRDCFVKMNGETSSTVRLSPVVFPDSTSVGSFMKCGSVWKLEIKNVSAYTAKITILSAD